MDGLAAKAAVAYEQLVSHALVRADVEDFLDCARRQVDYLLDALQKPGCFARIIGTLVTLTGNQVGRITLGEEDKIGVNGAAIGRDAHNAAVVADQALGGSFVKKRDAVFQRYLCQVMIVDRPQDQVAVAEGGRVAVRHAEQAAAVSAEKAALDQPALPGQLVQSLEAEDVVAGQVLAEENAAGPVFGAWKIGGFDGGHAEAGTRQADGRRQARRSRADYDHIVLGGNHPESSEAGTKPAEARPGDLPTVPWS